MTLADRCTVPFIPPCTVTYTILSIYIHGFEANTSVARLHTHTPGFHTGGGGGGGGGRPGIPPPPPPPPPQKTEDNINLILNWLDIPRSEHVKTCQLVTTLCMI